VPGPEENEVSACAIDLPTKLVKMTRAIVYRRSSTCSPTVSWPPTIMGEISAATLVPILLKTVFQSPPFLVLFLNWQLVGSSFSVSPLNQCISKSFRINKKKKYRKTVVTKWREKKSETSISSRTRAKWNQVINHTLGVFLFASVISTTGRNNAWPPFRLELSFKYSSQRTKKNASQRFFLYVFSYRWVKKLSAYVPKCENGN
jgi:hypothetical protein